MSNFKESKNVTKNFEFMDNQIKSNQIKSNQIKSNQIKSNQIKSNQIKSNQIKSNQIKSNQIKSNQIKSNQIKSNQIKSNQIKSNQIKSNQIKSNQIKSNQIKSNQIKSNQIKSNQIKFKPKTFLLATLCTAAILWGCKGDEPVTPKVEADFTLTFGSKGAVTFKNASKNATSYAWDFGDGSKSTEENPTHTYTKDSTYTVKLTATNAGGSAEKTRTVTISLEGTSTQLVANFTFVVDEKTAGKVTFTNTSEGATSYAWDFGDGNTSKDENPAHTYAKNDTYTVKLTATNAGGSDNTTKEVTITNTGITSIDIADLTQLAIKENSPKGTQIGEIVATVANTDETPVYSIKSQTPADAIRLNGNKIVVNDSSVFDFETRTEITGEIQGTVAGVTATAAFTISITNDLGEAINIPDANFKVKLVNDPAINTNGDQEISEAEAQAFTGQFKFEGSEAKDFTGIEYFTNLTRFNIENANKVINNIDVSNNTALTFLQLSRTGLTAIDVSQNTLLTFLSLILNQLTEIDVSNNTALEQLFLSDNKITAIDVSNTTMLTRLWLNNNSELTKVNLANGNNDKLTDLDLTNTPKLTCVQVDKLPIPSGWKFDSGKEGVFQTEACQ